MKKTSDYVTRQDLKEELGFLREDLREEIATMDDKNKGYRDEILTGLDKVVKELETIREESTIGAHQTSELREEVDSHEKRITKLESVAQ